jgi:hypothetical protein
MQNPRDPSAAKFSPKPAKRPVKVVFSTSDSPYPQTPKAPVRKPKKPKKK